VGIVARVRRDEPSSRLLQSRPVSAPDYLVDRWAVPTVPAPVPSQGPSGVPGKGWTRSALKVRSVRCGLCQYPIATFLPWTQISRRRWRGPWFGAVTDHFLADYPSLGWVVFHLPGVGIRVSNQESQGIS
jgi:hypothetical protein